MNKREIWRQKKAQAKADKVRRRNIQYLYHWFTVERFRLS